MNTATTGKIIKTNSEISKVMNIGSVVWSGEDDQTGSPGPKIFIGGNYQAGFFGEVPTSQFITGDELARRIGLTTGISQYSTEPWLKFSYLGKIEFIAKKPFRYDITWDNINAVNAVFGNRTININGKNYKVRLIKGKTEGKQNDYSSEQGDICKNSEWNRLMLPIHERAPSDWWFKENVNSPTENWNVKYRDNDLVTHWGYGEGATTLCQDRGLSATDCFSRGGAGISQAHARWPNDKSYHGWRPVLELIN